MASGRCRDKIKNFTNTEGDFLFFIAITLVIVFLLILAFTVNAQEIKSENMEKITDILEISNFPFFSNFTQEEIKQVLNRIINYKESEDLTYGILFLGALDEVEFMDMILTQKYKSEARSYFNNILDEKINLFSHWQKVGKNIYSLFKKGSSASPAASLALESVNITNKTIEIFIAFNNLKSMKLYDGLWYYFDLRKQGNESHKIAWEEAKLIMGWAGKIEIKKNKLFIIGKESGNDNIIQLEQQFLTLYNKWNPHITPYGISKEYKKQLASEIRNELAEALKEGKFAESDEISFWEEFVYQLKRAKNHLANLISRMNFFRAGPIVELPKESKEAASNSNKSFSDLELELKPESELEPKLEPGPDEVSDFSLNSTSTITTVLAVSTSTMEAATTTNIEDSPPENSTSTNFESESEIESEPELESELEAESEQEESIPSEPQLCRHMGQEPRRFRVLINEIAWMGTENSYNDEWIELKNIWGVPLDLSGWQLLDKDGQVAVIFEEESIISPNDFYLLERTDDETVPGIPADLIYTGSLNNTDEALYLFDDKCQLEDKVIAAGGWPAGDNTGKRSMERTDFFNWHTFQGVVKKEVWGTPKEKNGRPPRSIKILSSPEPALASAPPLLITEIQIEDASSTNHDFIKIHNPTDKKADISSFQLKKKSSTGREYSIRLFPQGSEIPAQGYFLWANYGQADASSTQTLAKDNSIALLDKEKNILDAVDWGSSTDPFVEGNPFSINTSTYEIIKRKWSTTTESYIDTNNNEDDFKIWTSGSESENAENEAEESEKKSPQKNYSVIFNEIAWAGTDANSADEWIELYNQATSSVDLAGWKIKKNEEEWITFATSSIPAQGYYLLERTDDQTISDIPADYFFTGGLNNSGEKLELFNSAGLLVDKIDCSDGWPGGQASPIYTSMEKVDSENWSGNNRIPWEDWQGRDADGNRVYGTPKTQNSVSKDFTVVQPGGFTIDDNFLLINLGSPYIIEGKIIVDSLGDLKIESGTVIKFKEDSGFDIEGKMEAENVIFTSFEEGQYWDWLSFKEGSEGDLERVIIEHGGRLHCPGFNPECPSHTEGMIHVNRGVLNIENATVTDSQTYGLWFENSSGELKNVEFNHNDYQNNISIALYIQGKLSDPVIKNSTFSNNKNSILIKQMAAPEIENNIFEGNVTTVETNNLLGNFSGNTAKNNDVNEILVSGFGFSEEVDKIEWKKSSLSYIINGSLSVPFESILEIKSGTNIKFKDGSIKVAGILEAKGTEQEKILFTSFAEKKGAGNYFSFSNEDSIIEHAIVENGGYLGRMGGINVQIGVIKIEDTTTALKNVLIRDNEVGIGLINGDFSGDTKSVNIEGNKIGIYVKGKCPDLKGIIFGNNENYNVWPEHCEK